MPRQPRRRRPPWRVVDQRRHTAKDRGYDSHWTVASIAYRRRHPLCVHCLLQGRLAASECVDHIVPIACVPELRLEVDNWQALCWSCHSYKTTQEPRRPWTPAYDRIVACGLPGVGMTTWAKERGAPYFDADELGLTTADEIRQARQQWIADQRGPCTVIVASGVSASQIAAQLRGVAKHLTMADREA